VIEYTFKIKLEMNQTSYQKTTNQSGNYSQRILRGVIIRSCNYCFIGACLLYLQAENLSYDTYSKVGNIGTLHVRTQWVEEGKKQ
jgi:hypothetical protein